MTAGPVHRFLAEDHVRLEALLQRSLAGDAIDMAAYDQFRAGLLRHIAMEEKVLVPVLRRPELGEPPRFLDRLRDDHATIAALLVPPPSRAIIAALREILAGHNPIEEGPGGLYELADQRAGAAVDGLLDRMRAIPPVRVAAYRDEPRVYQTIDRLLRDRAARRGTGDY
jgi:hypothetical protein